MSLQDSKNVSRLVPGIYRSERSVRVYVICPSYERYRRRSGSPVVVRIDRLRVLSGIVSEEPSPTHNPRVVGISSTHQDGNFNRTPTGRGENCPRAPRMRARAYPPDSTPP